MYQCLMGQATSVVAVLIDRVSGRRLTLTCPFFLLRVLRFYCIYSMANVQKIQAHLKRSVTKILFVD